jgi:hypothetical protein
MLSLVHGLEALGQHVLPLILTLAALLLVAYEYVRIREAVLRVFGIIRELLSGVADALDAVASTMRNAVKDVRRHVTDDERLPLPRLAVAVLALAPILFLLIVVEVRLWGAYFESLFPEQLEVPIIGLVPGGLLTALVPVAAGFLLGWLIEALFGTFPLPLLSGWSSPGARSRARGLLAIGLCMLWVLLAATVYDAANEVYDGLGPSTCALQFAPAAEDPTATAAPSFADASAAQTACVADWKANDRARSIRVILGELTLHLSALIAWVVLGAVGLGLLGGTATLALGAVLAAWFVRLVNRLVAALATLVEALLAIVRAIANGFVRLLTALGLPLPAVPSNLALHDTLAVVVTAADQPKGPNGVHTAV